MDAQPCNRGDALTWTLASRTLRRVGVNESIASAGVTRNGTRIFAATAAATIAALTAYGLLAPPTFTRVTLDTLFGDPASSSALFAAMAIGLGVLAAGSVLGTRFFERRWPWPVGPRVKAPVRRRWLPVLLSNAALILGMRLIQPALPHASGLYAFPDTQAAWLSVGAPADFALLGVVAVLAWTSAFTLGALIVIIWDQLRSTVRSRSPR